MRFIKRLFGIVETDITKIMGVFHQAKADLEGYISLHRAAAEAHALEAKAKQEASEALHVLADDGEALLEKIKAFTG